MSHQLLTLANHLARRPWGSYSPGRMMAEMDRLMGFEPFYPNFYRDVRPRRTQLARPNQPAAQPKENNQVAKTQQQQQSPQTQQQQQQQQVSRWNTRYDPRQNLDSLFPLTRMYNDLWRETEPLFQLERAAMPETEVEETDKAFAVTMDIPGVRKEDIKIKITGRDNRTLMVTAERREEVEEPVEETEQPAMAATSAGSEAAASGEHKADTNAASTSADKTVATSNSSEVPIQSSDDKATAQQTTRRRSVSTFRFSQTLELPDNIDVKNISAKCEHGQLKLNIPKLDQPLETETSIPIA